jgi:hypothetical protein
MTQFTPCQDTDEVKLVVNFPKDGPPTVEYAVKLSDNIDTCGLGVLQLKYGVLVIFK